MKDINIREIKKLAWDSLCDNLEQPVLISSMMILICLTVFLVGELLLTALRFYFPEPFTSSEITNIYTVIRIVISFAVIAPYVSGAIFWYALKYRSGSCPVKCALCCYRFSKRFVKAIWVNLMAALPAAVLSVAYAAVLVLIYTLCSSLAGSDGFTGTAILLGAAAAILTCAFIYLFIWITLRFSMSNIIFALDPDTSPYEILRMSAFFMSGKKWSLVRLSFSFMPWLPLTLLGFPALLILPYIFMSMTVYFDSIITEITGGSSIERFKERVAKHER